VGSFSSCAFSIDPAGTIAGIYRDRTAHPFQGGPSHGFIRDARGKVVSFDPPDSHETTPMRMSPSGDVTGWYQYDSNPSHVQGFVRDKNGTITTFAVPGAVATGPADINPAGEITGSYGDGRDGPIHGFVRSK
jgi:hypothetical protein